MSWAEQTGASGGCVRVLRARRNGAGSFAAALLVTAEAGARLREVDVVGARSSSAPEPLGAEDLRPLVARQVAGDQRRGALAALADGSR